MSRQIGERIPRLNVPPRLVRAFEARQKDRVRKRIGQAHGEAVSTGNELREIIGERCFEARRAGGPAVEQVPFARASR